MEKPVALGADHGGFALKEGRHVLGRRYRAHHGLSNPMSVHASGFRIG